MDCRADVDAVMARLRPRLIRVRAWDGTLRRAGRQRV